MNGHEFEYDFAEKNRWRTWQWATIANRFSVHRRRSALILYLPGKDGLDIREAERFGFRRENMIGVEKEYSACKRIRRNGILCVHGDFTDVVRLWPQEPKLSVIVGDFCSGLNPIHALLGQDLCIFDCFTRDCVCALNFMRGRDSETNPIRDMFRHVYDSEELKHRGRQYLFMGSFFFYRRTSGSLELHEQFKSWNETEMLMSYRQQCREFKVRFNGYQSTAIVLPIGCAPVRA